MMVGLYIVAAFFASLLFALTIVFDVCVYLRSKDFDFALSVWASRHTSIDQRLLPMQAVLLKAICLTERGLKYFFYFVLIPLSALFVFFTFRGAQ